MTAIATADGTPGASASDRRADRIFTVSRTAPLAVALVTASYAFLAAVAGDSRWLAALGRNIDTTWSIPHHVPFASALSGGWENVPALAETIFYALHASLGDRGFLLLHVAAIAVGVSLLASDARASRAGDRATAAALLVFAVTAFPALVAIRAQLFSLALFPLVLLLLRSEARRPSWRVWLLVPIVALWSNLHGAVLVGVAVAGAYLIFSRARLQPGAAFGVLASMLGALLATPSLYRTPAYYIGVFENESATRGIGLWERFSFHSVADLVVIGGLVVIAAGAVRARPAAWEVVALVGLAILTVQADRNAVWLAAFCITPAAAAFGRRTRSERPLARWLSYAIALVAVALVTLAFARGPLALSAGDKLVAKAIAESYGTPILAENQLSEQVALAGGTIWLGNPLDAFLVSDQAQYFDWVEGRPAGDETLEHAPRVVLVTRDGRAAKRLGANGDFRRVAEDDHAVLYERVAG